MQEKFIDLCVDDNHSNYGNEMPQRQERFQAHLAKLNFQFKTDRLDMAQSSGSAPEISESDISELKEIDSQMGMHLDAISEIMSGNPYVDSGRKVVITHQWQDK